MLAGWRALNAIQPETEADPKRRSPREFGLTAGQRHRRRDALSFEQCRQQLSTWRPSSNHKPCVLPVLWLAEGPAKIGVTIGDVTHEHRRKFLIFNSDISHVL